MLEKKPFGDRPPLQWALLGLIPAISLVIVGVAERDLQGASRGADSRQPVRLAVRQPRCSGAIAYLRLGRR